MSVTMAASNGVWAKVPFGDHVLGVREPLHGDLDVEKLCRGAQALAKHWKDMETLDPERADFAEEYDRAMLRASRTLDWLLSQVRGMLVRCTVTIDGEEVPPSRVVEVVKEPEPGGADLQTVWWSAYLGVLRAVGRSARQGES